MADPTTDPVEPVEGTPTPALGGTPSPADPAVTPTVEPVDDPAVAAAAEPVVVDKNTAASTAMQRRIDELTREKYALLRQVAAKPVAPADPAKPVAVPTEADLDAEATRRAQMMVLNDESAKVHTAGRKIDPDFQGKVDNLNRAGLVSASFLEAVFEAGDNHEGSARIISALGASDNFAEAQRILSLPAHRQGVALAKFAAALEVTPEAEPANALSAAAEPIKPVVKGGVQSKKPSLEDPNLSIDQWMRLRKEQKDSARKGMH